MSDSSFHVGILELGHKLRQKISVLPLQSLFFGYLKDWIMKRTGFRKKMFFITFQCLLVIILMELTLRLLKPARVVGISYMPCIYAKDELTGHKYIPKSRGWYHRYFEMDNTIIINSLGYHDVERKYDRGKKGLRIAVIGDSFTAALEVPVSSTWTQVLELNLNENTKSSIEVINLGLDGTGTDIHKYILECYLQSNKVDVAILAFYENDIRDMQVKRVFREIYNGYVLIFQNEEQKKKLIEYLDKNKYSHPARWLYQHCYFFRAITNRRGRSRLLRKNFISSSAADINTSEYTKQESSNRIEETFLSLISLQNKHNFKLLIMPVPAKNGPDESMTALLNNISQETFNKLDIINVSPVVKDLLKTEGLDYNQLFWKHDNHFNLTGNRIIGTTLAKLLIDAGWIQLTN